MFVIVKCNFESSTMKLVTLKCISSLDFDAITDPIMKAKMVALKGINKVMAQNNMGMPPMVMNR